MSGYFDTSSYELVLDSPGRPNSFRSCIARAKQHGMLQAALTIFLQLRRPAAIDPELTTTCERKAKGFIEAIHSGWHLPK